MVKWSSIGLLLMGLVLVSSTALRAEPIAPLVCGTSEPDPLFAQVADEVAREYMKSQAAKSYEIPIAFHIIAAGKKDRIAISQIQAMVNNLNVGFQGTPFSFYLARVDLVNKKAWHDNCGPGTKNEKAMKKRLAVDPAHVINIYSCNPLLPGLPPGLVVLGLSTFPFQYPENSYFHSVSLHPSVLPGGSNQDYGQYGLVAIHELGHYLGLFHTFQDGCADGDLVADTPAQEAPHFACPLNIDTCLDNAGSDDVHNFMNYSNDQCMTHFTPGQIERMEVQTGFYRPSL
jgi:hypothetical protein